MTTAHEHVVSGAHHCVWDRDLAPALHARPGDVVTFVCREPADGQFTPEATVETVRKLDYSRLHSLSGPVFVEGAQPGDAVTVELLEFAHEGWAWTAVEPGFGVLHEQFGDAYGLQIWRVDADGFAVMKRGVRVAIEPFCGVVGVAPAEPGRHLTIPPRAFGGNVDCRHLCAGATVSLPVQVPGALLSLGDGHLGQGDGEVCGTALEAPMSVTVRLGLREGAGLERLQAVTTRRSTSRHEGAGYYVTTAAGDDLDALVRDAVSDMVRLLSERHELERMEAYMLCSVAGDLKIAVPKMGPRHAGFVTFHFPRAVLGEETAR